MAAGGGPYAPLGAPAAVVRLAERLAAERPSGVAEDEGSPLIFDLAA